MTVSEEIVLGEGVAIDAGAASVAMRIGSGLIDVIISFAAFIALNTVASMVAFGLNDAAYAAILTSLVVLSFVAIPATIETLTRGLSVGKLAVGLRIVRDDGGPISARHAIGRALVGFFEIFVSFGMIAVPASFFSDKGKRVGDMLVGTYAMRTRGGRASMPPVVMPFALSDWASKADARRLPDGLALTARMFLGRLGGLSYDSRIRLGMQIADAMRPYVAPAPPPGTHPETFIAAVIATRRDREYQAGRRQELAAAAELKRLASLPYGIEDADA